MTFTLKKIEYDSKEFQEAAELRFQICCLELHWFDPSDYQNHQECDDFDRHAKHFGMYSGNRLIGCCRLIVKANKFPTETYSEQLEVTDRKQWAEVSRLVVLKPYRNSPAALNLIQAAYATVLDLNIQHVISLVEPSMYRLLNKIGMPFQKVGNPIVNALGANVLIPSVVKVSEIEFALEAV